MKRSVTQQFCRWVPLLQMVDSASPHPSTIKWNPPILQMVGSASLHPPYIQQNSGIVDNGK
ncbi:MAG TPA: hypothetical protein ENK58_08990 [Desulfobacterales bacterium]|nr:hypothetical protein [Desulfobacterales bacterium]